MIPYRINPNEYFIDKLSLDHTDFIAEHSSMIKEFHPVTKQQVSKYFKNILLTYKLSAAVFLRSNPMYPVSWGTYSDCGLATNLSTLPDHRQKGLALALSANLFAQMQRQGIVPVVERHKDSPVVKRFSKVEECVLESTWRDSITGECYW